MNHYEVLGVGKNATPEELKVAKRKKARQHHPDRGGDARAMVRVNQAYDTLADPHKREYYDLHGQDEPPRPTQETQALQTIYNIILQLSDQVGEEFDFVSAVRENLVNNRETLKYKAPKLEAALRKAEKQRRTIRHKKPDAENLLMHVFDQKIAAFKEQIDAIPAALIIATKAIEILAEYEYCGSALKARPDPFAALMSPYLDQLMRGRR